MSAIRQAVIRCFLVVAWPMARAVTLADAHGDLVGDASEHPQMRISDFPPDSLPLS